MPKPQTYPALPIPSELDAESIDQRGTDRAEEAIATQIYPGITMDPGVRFGKPCIAGTQIDVATVVGAVGADDSLEAVREAYSLSRDQGPGRIAL